MNKLPFLFILIVFFLLNTTAAFCGLNAGTGLRGSKHDMSIQSPDPQGRLCIFCHIPHHASDGTTLAPPVWAGTMQNKYFIPYNSTTLDANIEDVVMGPTLMCLTCHDGVIAGDSHPNLRADNFGGAGVGIGNDLSNDHPIGFNYLTVIENNPYDFKLPETIWLDGIGGISVINSLYQGKYMTCASCHDMHNTKNVSDAINSYNYFVYSRQNNSSLCLSCHNK